MSNDDLPPTHRRPGDPEPDDRGFTSPSSGQSSSPQWSTYQDPTHVTPEPGPAATAPYPAQPYPGQQPYGQHPYSQGQPPAYPYGQPPHPGTPGYGAPGGGPSGYYQQELSQANTAFILGLVALIGGFVTSGCLAVCGPVAWVMGSKARKTIKADPRWSGYDKATAGMWMGIVSSVFLVLGLLVVLYFFGLVGWLIASS